MQKKRALGLVLNKASLVSGQYVRLTFNLKRTKASIRHDVMNGRDHLVVPCVMMTEGVHTGSLGPLYYPAEELSKTPAAWNMKPVVVYHPELNGQGISACDPDIVSGQGIGVLMNTRWDKDGGLKTECWLEEDKTKEVDDRVLDALEAGTMMEVSTGLFTDNEMDVGEWNGKEYKGIARNYRPDHLAILPDKTGACSIEDGAGLLRNVHEAAEQGTPEAFQALGQAISSLARGQGQGQGGPRQGDGGTDTCVCPECGATAKHDRGTPCTKVSCSKCGAKMVGSSSIKNALRAFYEVLGNDLSHEELRNALEVKISDAVGQSAWVVVVYDDFVIYEENILLASIGSGGLFYQRYELAEDEEIKLVGVRMEATKEEQYRLSDDTVVGNEVSRQEEAKMDKKKEVDGLIANETSPWSEEDRKVLMGMSEDQLKSVVKNADGEDEEDKKEGKSPAETSTKTPTAAPAPEENVEEEDAPTENVTVDEYIDNAPEGMRDMLRAGVTAHAQEKAKFVQMVTANERNPFTAEQLQEKGLEELKGLAQLAEVVPDKKKPLAPSFAGQAPVTPTENEDAEEALVAPTMGFESE